MDIYCAPLEVKFADGAPEGIFSGYGAVFGNIDAHGDVIQPGAFTDSIAERKAQGRAVPMHLMHRVYGGDGFGVEFAGGRRPPAAGVAADAPDDRSRPGRARRNQLQCRRVRGAGGPHQQRRGRRGRCTQAVLELHLESGQFPGAHHRAFGEGLAPNPR
jgi:hypothetical protein